MAASLCAASNIASIVRRGAGHRDEVLGWCEGRHRLAVIVELAGGTITRVYHLEFVGPLQGYIIAHGINERRAKPARVLVTDDRGERYRVGCGQFRARGFQNLDRLGLEHRRGRW